MIGKISVGNPQLKIDYNNNYEITFPVNYQSNFAVKQIMNDLQKNQKELSITVDYKRQHRSLDQNALMWGLLTEYALHQNGGRKGGVTEEELYIKLLSRYGIATMVLVEEKAFETLKMSYKDVILIDKGYIKGNLYCKCKCVIGSSNYDTKQMKDLIDGILDEMAEAGIETANKRDLEEQWRAYNNGRQ